MTQHREKGKEKDDEVTVAVTQWELLRALSNSLIFWFCFVENRIQIYPKYLSFAVTRSDSVQELTFTLHCVALKAIWYWDSSAGNMKAKS